MSNKRMLYVGGLADEVNQEMVRAAFIPFGELIEINMPLDYASQKHKGFAFVEFEEQEDAAHAIENMNDAEIYGKTIRVNLAKPIRTTESSTRAVWQKEEWLQKYAGKSEGDLENGNKTEPNSDDKIEDESVEKETKISKPISSGNPEVFIEIRIDGRFEGRIKISLRKDVVPLTVANCK